MSLFACYNTAMSRLLKQYDLDQLGKTASHLLNCMDHLPAVEELRAKQPDPDSLNHPSWVWRQYLWSSRGQDRKRKNKHQRDSALAAQIRELKRELEQRDAHIEELEAHQSHSSSEAPDTDHHHESDAASIKELKARIKELEKEKQSPRPQAHQSTDPTFQQFVEAQVAVRTNHLNARIKQLEARIFELNAHIKELEARIEDQEQ